MNTDHEAWDANCPTDVGKGMEPYSSPGLVEAMQHGWCFSVTAKHFSSLTSRTVRSYIDLVGSH